MKNLAIVLMFVAWVIGTLLIIATFIGVAVLLIVDDWFEIPGKLISKLSDKQHANYES